jgi:hypothetical protein
MKKLTQTTFFFGLCLFLGLLLGGCSHSPQKESDVPTIRLKDATTIAMIEYDDPNYVESYSLIQLETIQESLLGNISQVQLFENQLYILDRQSGSLLVFHTDGSFSRRIGSQGRGPNEFLAVCTFYINPEKRQITLFDPMGSQAVVYDLEGRFIEKKEQPGEGVLFWSIQNASYLSDGQIVCYSPPNGMTEDILFVLNEEDMSLAERLVKRPFEIDQVMYSIGKNPFSVVDGELHYVQWFDNAISAYDQETATEWLDIDLDKPLIPNNLLKNIASSNSGNFSQTIYDIANKGDYSLGFQDIYETDRFIFVNFLLENVFPKILVIDKKNNESVYVTDSFRTDLGINKMLYASGNTLIVSWDSFDIQNLLTKIDLNQIDPDRFTPQIIDLARSFDPAEDNPALLIMTIKE